MTDLPLIVIGAGGHAKVLIDALRRSSATIMCAVDATGAGVGRAVLGVPILGGDEFVLERSPGSVLLANGVGSLSPGSARHAVFRKFAEAGYRFSTVVHPGATLGAGVDLGEGAQVMAGAVIQAEASVGDNSIVNTRGSVDHDCRIGSDVHIAPGATLSGGVEVGDGSHIGVGATILQGIRIGRGCMIAAGAVVIRDVADGAAVAGVPAMEMKR